MAETNSSKAKQQNRKTRL